ncbi:hypothetical protein VTN96DRAFT_2398 [Rasamsonia emersonii]
MAETPAQSESPKQSQSPKRSGSPKQNEPTGPNDQSSQPPIEVDAQATDNDAAMTDVSCSSTYSTSLTSSVVDYRVENGRRYHAYRDGSYLLPNDEEESDRLDMAHELNLKMMERKPFLRLLDHPHSESLTLRLGRGYGQLILVSSLNGAFHFCRRLTCFAADLYPSAEVIGNDLSPIQPSMVPPNLKFVVDDIESDWGYENTPFDFIHARYLGHSIRNFKKVIQECYKCTKPGG